jgi:hypothetical protein
MADERRPDRSVISRPRHPSGPFEVLAECRGTLGLSWGVLIRWSDPDGRAREWAIPCSMLFGDGQEVRAHLMDAGLYVSSGRNARSLFNAYLGNVRTAARARSVTATGWYGSTFVFPDNAAIGDAEFERVILQVEKPMDHAFDTKGTLDEWKANVGRYAVGNSRIALSSHGISSFMGTKDDEYSEQETIARAEAALKRMLSTPHQPHKEMKLGRKKQAVSGPTYSAAVDEMAALIAVKHDFAARVRRFFIEQPKKLVLVALKCKSLDFPAVNNI